MAKRRELVFVWGFLLPSLLLFGMFFAVPLFQVIVTAFCDWSLVTPPVFSGLANFKELLSPQSDFGPAFWHTVEYTALTLLIQVPFSLIVALVLTKKPLGWRFTRNVFVIPNLISTAAIGMIFMNIMDPDFGVINAMVRVFVPGFNVNWLQNDQTAFWAVACSWIFFGGQSTLLILAEISSIPESVMEAAKIDGATSLQTDCFIVLPMLRNIIGTVSILAASFAITEFSEVFILTRGGPGNSTLNLGVYLYKSAMLENNYGLANAIGVFQLLLGMVAVVLINKLFRVGEEI